MDGTRLRLLRVRGIPIYIDLSWLLVFALVTLTLAGEFTRALSTGVEQPAYVPWVMAAAGSLGFFTCIVLHELGHALVGKAYGVPFRGITLFLFGGVAELRREPPSARSEFWMAVAGPIVTGALVGTIASVSALGASADWPVQVVLVLDYLVYVNIFVLVFNLVPAFPLDGGRVFRAAVWALTGDLRRATRWAAAAGRGFGWLLTFLGVVELFAGFVVSGIWLVFVGQFLAVLARQAYEQVVARELLAGVPVSKVMTREPITVPPDLDLKHLVEDYVYRHHRKAFPVSVQRPRRGPGHRRAAAECAAGKLGAAYGR